MLKSLVIKNFRSLADFEVAKLGRVNLIVGKNNSGKSSVLEALRIYAGNGQRALLETISAEHDERYRIKENERGEFDAPLPFQDFFTGRKFPVDDSTVIQIGSVTVGKDVLHIQYVFLTETVETVTSETGESSTRVRRKPVLTSEIPDLQGEVKQALQITKGEKPYPPFILDSSSQRFRPPMFDAINAIPCSMIPTQFVSLDELADEWDKIVFTEHEEVVRQAMRIIAPEFENLTFVRNEDERPGYRSTIRRSAKVKLSDLSRPVPLNSLGDGMLRVLQLALKIYPAKGGFLLIDEFENGLHYSVQEKVWALLFEMAQKLDIQVFATTHSWDCIESFSKIAIDRKDIDGVLFRVGKSVRDSDRGRVIATVFDEEALYSITQSDVEVR
ncbi:ATP/GTP-binding protein [Crenothrix sp.]|uniref:AAA family ATPase n=1 Tax=Crenothrix sp. TaxID=3100433 RepID=UPI00374CF9A2